MYSESRFAGHSSIIGPVMELSHLCCSNNAVPLCTAVFTYQRLEILCARICSGFEKLCTRERHTLPYESDKEVFLFIQGQSQHSTVRICRSDALLHPR